MIEQIENVVNIHVPVFVIVGIVTFGNGITVGKEYVIEKVNSVVFRNGVVFVYVTGNDS